MSNEVQNDGRQGQSSNPERKVVGTGGSPPRRRQEGRQHAQKSRAATETQKSSQGMHTGTFIILVVVSLVLLAQGLGQMQIHLSNHERLERQIALQQNSVDEATVVRRQLESIAGDLATLAQQGNVNAARIRDTLAQQGITISPPK